MDFTLNKYRALLTALIDQGYAFQTFEEYLVSANPKSVILRHDVDKNPENTLKMSRMENELGVKGSYHFRFPERESDERIIRQIVSGGNEAAYHYEEIDLITKGSLRLPAGIFSRSKKSDASEEYKKQILQAYELFRTHLDRMREIFPVRVISMHGSPLSPYDNRDLWKFHSYRELGILCEAYFDIDYSRVLYLTDTGRTWNGDKYNFRDKPVSGSGLTSGPVLRDSYFFDSTDSIIKSVQHGQMPSHIIVNTHPQRWNDNIIKWLREAMAQKAKNIFKRLLLQGRTGC